MSTSTRYAVRLGDGTWSGASRYSYQAGRSRAGETLFPYAKLFSRKADADNRARSSGPGAMVVPVMCSVEEPL